MPSHLAPFDDEILGRMAWNSESCDWRANLQLPSGTLFFCHVIPADSRLPLHDQGIERVREPMRWLLMNEPKLREKIANAVFDWWYETWFDAEIDTVTTKIEFASTISLAGVDVYEDLEFQIHYNDGDMIGGHGILLTIDSRGEITKGPNIWG